MKAPLQTPQARLENALQTALAQFTHTMGEPFRHEVWLDLVDGDEFAALVEPDGDRYRIAVNIGTVSTVDGLWGRAWADSELLAYEGERLADDLEGLADLSLTWLMLHELMHIRLEHFQFKPEARIAETHASNGLSLLEPASREPPPMVSKVPAVDRPLISPCLELQADSEATDILIDAYADDRWGDIRLRAACIFVMMALIEREDQRRSVSTASTSGSHPMAITRLFVMIAHLSQMWAHLDIDFESSESRRAQISSIHTKRPEIFDAYSDAVLAPAFNDAVIIALAAGARSFTDDIGGARDLLPDISAAQSDDLSADKLKSAAAQEWYSLLPVNERLMELTGLRQ